MTKLQGIITEPKNRETFEEICVENMSVNKKPISSLAQNDRTGILNSHSPTKTAITPKNVKRPVTFFDKGEFIQKWLMSAESQGSSNSIVENSIASFSDNKRWPRSPLKELNRIKRARLDVDSKSIQLTSLTQAEQAREGNFQDKSTIDQRNGFTRRNFGQIVRVTDEYETEISKIGEFDRKIVEESIIQGTIMKTHGREPETIERSLFEQLTNERILPSNFSSLRGIDEEMSFTEKISTVSSPKTAGTSHQKPSEQIIQTVSTPLTPRSKLEACRAAVFDRKRKLNKNNLFDEVVSPGAKDVYERTRNDEKNQTKNWEKRRKNYWVKDRASDLSEIIKTTDEDQRSLLTFGNLAISQTVSMASKNLEIESAPSSISSESLTKADIVSIESTQRIVEDMDSGSDEEVDGKIENPEENDKTSDNSIMINSRKELTIEHDEDENIDEIMIEEENINVNIEDEEIDENFDGYLNKNVARLSDLIENPVFSQFSTGNNEKNFRNQIEKSENEMENFENGAQSEDIGISDSQDSDRTYFSGGIPVNQTIIEEPSSQEIYEARVSRKSSKSKFNSTISDRTVSVTSKNCRKNEEMFPIVIPKIIKKRKKAKKGSMLKRYQTLMSAKISFLRMWRHQMGQACFKGTCNQFITIKISEYSTSYGRPYFRGKIVQDTHNLLQKFNEKTVRGSHNDSASGSSLNRTITVLIIPEVVGQFNVKEKSAFRLYPPWEVIDADKLILSGLYFNLITDDESENSPEESHSNHAINNVVVQEFNCPCLMARKLTNFCEEKFEKIKPSAMDYFFSMNK